MGWRPPDWVVIYQMAEEFHTTPWAIEEQCSQEWLERYLAYSQARSQERERQSKSSGVRRGKRNH